MRLRKTGILACLLTLKPNAAPAVPTALPNPDTFPCSGKCRDLNPFERSFGILLGRPPAVNWAGPPGKAPRGKLEVGGKCPWIALVTRWSFGHGKQARIGRENRRRDRVFRRRAALPHSGPCRPQAERDGAPEPRPVLQCPAIARVAALSGPVPLPALLASRWGLIPERRIPCRFAAGVQSSAPDPPAFPATAPASRPSAEWRTAP